MAGAGQAGASSSYASTSTDRSLTYDVFLNFRGEDTRKGFTGHLYSALKRERINVFIDSHELREGEEIGPKLMEAIEGSKISVPIFSKGYADSKWCLMELEKILECHKSNHQIVLPIFFDVEPSDIRHQSGRSFGKAFLEHLRNPQPEKVKRWREALSEVGSMKGWVLNQIDINGDESTLIQRVVERILRETSSIYLSDVKYAVGLDSHVNAIRSLLNIGSNDVQFIGLCGEGGIGKTTVAKTLYNLFVKSFHQNCFLQNIREEALGGSNGLVSLQEKLIYSITKKKVTGEILLVDRGKEEIRNRCEGVNVLLVLDDVDDRSQLDALAIDLKWLGQGSRVIITTRDEHVLNVANIDPNNIYRPKELDFGQSLRLFSLHAFKQDEPLEEYKELSHDVARYSGGLPLTLEVLGSYLSDIRNKEEWEIALQKLRASPHKEVYKKLKISYDNLEDGDQKAIFLDAACFFVGWKKRDVISVWEACEYHPKLAIKRLVQRCLLKFTANEELEEEWEEDLEEYLEMHDQIRDMGRQIVLEESCGMLGKRSRLWTRKEIVEVLEGHKGTEYIKGIHLPDQWIESQFSGICLPIQCLEKMSNLRFLDIKYDDHSKGDDFPHLPCELRWFNWTRCPIEVLPDNFYHKRLVHLDLSFSKIQLAWHIRPQNEYKFQNLKVLKLGDCPISICPNFSWFPSLEQLDLSSCEKLFEIDESIGQLSHLKSLKLGYCNSLKKLPESIGGLKSLLELHLEGTKIEELPDSICKLSSLQKLGLSWCRSFNRLPESIGDLKSLLKLNLQGTKINELPDSICRLSSLQRLYLKHCESLNRLPESIGDLKSLLKLNLQETEINELPDSICRLSSLERLNLSQCESLNKLPESIGDLKSLLELNLEGTEINELPDSICRLSSLQRLNLSQCKSLNKLPESIGDLKSLPELHLDRTKIEELPDSICKLSSLQKLDLSWCRSFNRLPESIGDLKSLLELCLWGTNINELPDSICELSSLKWLGLRWCKSLNRLPESIGDLKSLLKLELEEIMIEELPNSICRLSSLQRLCLRQCKSLSRLPESIGDLKSLHELELEETNINELPDSICKLSSLQRLSLRQCKSLNRLPESIGDLKSLLKLELEETMIEELPNSICRLSSLRRLCLRQCKSLSRLPESIGDPKSLLELDLEGSKIEELPDSICRLSSLQRLLLSQCQSLNRLPESIGDLKSLVLLRLDKTEIGELPESVGLLEKLEKLSVQYCRKPVKLPRSMGRMGCLRKINLEGTELPTDFPMVSSLEELSMTCECNVVGIRYNDFSHLQRLELIDCPTLEALPADLLDMKNLRELVLSKLKKLRYLLELPSSLNSFECLGCTSLERLPDLSSLESLSKLYLTDCYRLEKIRGLEGLKSLKDFLVMGCHYKALQRRPLLVDLQFPMYLDLEEYSFLNANDGIHKQLFLIIVFAFESGVEEKLEEGELVEIELTVSADVFRGYGESIWCRHSIFVENVEFTTKRDIIYIHHLQEFAWFGLPLGGKDVSMTEVFVTGPFLYKLSDSGVYHRIFGGEGKLGSCVELKSWSLEYVNEESGKALPNQEWGDNMTMIDMLSGPWPHAHADADADAGAGSHRVFVSHSALTEEGPFRTEYIVSNYGNVRPCLRDTKERIYFVLEGPHEEDNNTIEVDRLDSNYPLEEPEEDKRSIIEESDCHPVLGEDKFSSACVDGGRSHSVPQEEEKSDKKTDPIPSPGSSSCFSEKDPPLCSQKKRTSVTSPGIGSVGPGDDAAGVAEETPEASSTNRRSTRKKRRPSTLSDYV